MQPPALDLEGLRTSIGDTLEARFEVGNRVTEDGEAEVFTARDRELGRTIEVKRPPADASEADTRRLLVEAQVAAQLSHPNVVPLYSLEITRDGQPCFTTQRVRGESLAKYIARAGATRDARGGSYALVRRLEIFLAVCDAIAYAHARGVYHRNLSAAAVTLGPFAEVFVTDWGFAMLGSPGEGTPLELTVAPPSSISGPVVVGGPPPKPRDADGDRRALARLLAQVVTLRDTDDAAGGRAWLPRDLRAILQAAERGTVYGDVNELAEDIRRFLRAESPAAAPDSPLRRLERRLRRHPIDVLVALLLAIAVGGAFVVVRTFDAVSAQSELATRKSTLARLSAAVTARADQLGGVAIEVETELYAARAALAVAETSTTVETTLRTATLRTSAIRAYAVIDGHVYIAGAPTPALAKLAPRGTADARWDTPIRRAPHEPWVVPVLADLVRPGGPAYGVVGLDMPVASFTVLTTRSPVRGLDTLRLVDERGRTLDAQGITATALSGELGDRLSRRVESDIIPHETGATVLVRIYALGWYLVGESENAE